MQNIMRNCKRAGCQGEKAITQSAPRRRWKEAISSWASGFLAWSSSPPQNSEGLTSTHCPSDCASPSTWESPEAGGKQRGRVLKGTVLHWLL